MSSSHNTAVLSDTDFAAAWSEWHAALEASRREPYGFLALTGIDILDRTPRRFTDVPGAWSVEHDSARVDLAPGEILVVDDRTLTGRHDFGVIEERSRLRLGTGDDTVVELSKRGGEHLVRPLRPSSERRTGYAGTPAYEPDPRWVVTGRFVPWRTPLELSIDAAVDGIVHRHSSPGTVEFEIDGVELSLIVFEGGPKPGSLFTVFTDATSGITTYPASRSLSGLSVSDDSTVVLDFTRTSNLQCAYTPYAPCPLAPAHNRLPIAVEAGEKLPNGTPRLSRSTL